MSLFRGLETRPDLVMVALEFGPGGLSDDGVGRSLVPYQQGWDRSDQLARCWLVVV